MDGPLVQLVSNLISTVTILSCVFLKIPQIMYLRSKQSADGIYVEAMLLEIIGFTIVTLYNFTNHYGVLTYLEYPIILLQVFVMLFYVLKYKKMLNNPIVPLAALGYLLFVLGFATELLPSYFLSYMVPFCTPISGFAKVTYIYGIIKSSNADAVSLTTWIISICTNVSRLFTIYVDSADKKLMFNLTVSSLLSAGVLLTAQHFQCKKGSKVNCVHHHHD